MSSSTHQLVRAEQITGSDPYRIYTTTSKILSNAYYAAKKQLIANGEVPSDCHGDYTDEQDNKIEDLQDKILDKQWNDMEPSEREKWEAEQIESRNLQWRNLRKEGRLIENEESLVQKVKEEEEEEEALSKKE